jgi:hypothetical protein
MLVGELVPQGARVALYMVDGDALLSAEVADGPDNGDHIL